MKNFDELIVPQCDNQPVDPSAHPCETPPCTPVVPQNCYNPQYAAAHLLECSVAPRLILKPETGQVPINGELIFKTFLVSGGKETELTDGLVYSTIDPAIGIIGAASGYFYGVAAGNVGVTVTYGGLSAQAEVTVVASCDLSHTYLGICIDDSESMTAPFSAESASRLEYAKRLALSFIASVNLDKDYVAVTKFGTSAAYLQPFTQNRDLLNAAVNSIAATTEKTSILTGLKKMVRGDQSSLDTAFSFCDTDVCDSVAPGPLQPCVLILFTDGENNVTGDHVAYCQQLKDAGFIVVVVGIRASNPQFSQLNQAASHGFFFNAYDTIEDLGETWLNGLKTYVCSGGCIKPGDVNLNVGALNYDSFEHWIVQQSFVDLIGNGFFDFLPGNGLYVDMAGSSDSPGYGGSWWGRLYSRVLLALTVQVYTLKVRVAGNQRAPADQSLRVKVLTDGGTVALSELIHITDYTQDFTEYEFTFTPTAASHRITLQMEGTLVTDINAYGLLVSSVQLLNAVDTVVFEDDFDTENETYIPPKCAAPVELAMNIAFKAPLSGVRGGDSYPADWTNDYTGTVERPGNDWNVFGAISGGGTLTDLKLSNGQIQTDLDVVISAEPLTWFPSVVGKVTEKSYLQTFLDGTGTVVFSGIPNGMYRVIVYSIIPGDADINGDSLIFSGDEDTALPVADTVNRCDGGSVVVSDGTMTIGFVEGISAIQIIGFGVNGAAFSENGDLVDAPDSYPASCGATGCLDGPIPAQRSDPNPLPVTEGGGDPPPPPPPPQPPEVTLTVSPISVCDGAGNVELVWTSNNLSSLPVLTWGAETLTLTEYSGSMTMVQDDDFTGTTTFTITGSNAAGEDTATATVTVAEAPVIDTFTANNAAVCKDDVPDDSQVGFSWTITSLAAPTVKLWADSGDGFEVVQTGLPKNGSSVAETPLVTTTYKLTAETGCGGVIESDEIEITVYGAPEVMISRNKAAVCIGASSPADDVVISWEVVGADTQTVLYVNGVPQNVDDEDSITFSPTVATTYKIRAVQSNCGAHGVTEETVQVGAYAPPTITSFTRNPTTICATAPNSDTSTLSWVVAGASAVTITPAGGSAESVNPVSGTLEVNPSVTTVYTISATNAGCAAVTAQVTVTVECAPCAYDSGIWAGLPLSYELVSAVSPAGGSAVPGGIRPMQGAGAFPSSTFCSDAGQQGDEFFERALSSTAAWTFQMKMKSVNAGVPTDTKTCMLAYLQIDGGGATVYVPAGQCRWLIVFMLYYGGSEDPGVVYSKEYGSTPEGVYTKITTYPVWAASSFPDTIELVAV